MVLYRLLERRLHGKHPFIDRGRIVAIESDHLGAGLSTADDLECIGLDAFDRGVGY